MKPRTETRYELSVWNNMNGDHVKKLWDASETELDALIEQYDDEPWFEVVIDREWEEASDAESAS